MSHPVINFPDFDTFRENDGTINLYDALTKAQDKEPTEAQAQYLENIITMRPCKSRQLAAFIIATLIYFDR
jgi:hypothetical protein